MNQNEKTNNATKPDSGPGCEPELVKRFVSNKLADGELVRLEDHLDDCSKCQTLLETETADSDSWTEAVYSLRDSEGWYASNTAVEDGETAGDSAEPYINKMVLKSLAPSDDPEMLGRIGAYEVSGVIGQGGMGVVLKAHDRSLNRIVALKVLRPFLAISGAARQRFFREARAAATINHDNVMPIHSVGESSSELPYLVMPYVRGESLQQRIARSGPFSTIEVVRIGMQVASGLNAAHEQGLVHRDIKPANIILEEGVEKLWITDFGLARLIDDASLTRTGVIAGTPEYMSPEQAKGDSLDERSDLFSLGALMYAAATGHPPFRASTSYGVMRRITDDDPRPIREINTQIPQWLESFIFKLLSKDPKDRIGSASEVERLLKESLAHLQHPTAFELPSELNEFKNSRKPGGLVILKAFALATATVLLIGFGLFAVSGLTPDVVASKMDPAVNSSWKDATSNIVSDEPKHNSTQNESDGTSPVGLDSPIVVKSENEFPPTELQTNGFDVRGAQWNKVGSEQILPANTAFWFSIRNHEQLATNFNKTQIGKMFASDEMKPFVADFKSDIHLMMKEFGVPLSKNLLNKPWVNGTINVALTRVLDDFRRGKTYSPIVLIDVMGLDQAAYDSVKDEFAKLKFAQQGDIVIGNGETVCSTIFGDPKNLQTVFHGVSNGWLVIGTKAGPVGELLIKAKKGVAVKAALEENPSFKKVMSQTRLEVKPDIIWFVNPFEVSDLIDNLNRSNPSKDDWIQVLFRNGFDVFSGIGGRIALATGDHEFVHRAFVCHSEDLRATAAPGKFRQPRKRNDALGLFDFVNLDLPTLAPTWVKDDAASCLVVDWNKNRALRNFGTFYDAFIEEAGSWNRLLNDFKIDPDMQLDIEKLVDQLDHRTTIIWNSTKPADAKMNFPVFGLAIKGDPKFVMECVLRATSGKKIKLAGHEAVASKVDRQDELDDAFNLPDDKNTEDNPVELEPKYFVMVDKVLLVSNNKTTLKRILDKKHGRLVESKDYVRVQTTLDRMTDESKVAIRHFGRLDLSLRSYYEPFRTGELRWFEWIPRETEPSKIDLDAPEQKPKRKQRFDGSSLPKNFDKSVAPFLGLFGWVLESREDGWMITGGVLEKE